MEQTIYEVYSFESNQWVECDKYEYDKTEDKYRRIALKTYQNNPQRVSAAEEIVVKENGVAE